MKNREGHVHVSDHPGSLWQNVHVGVRAGTSCAILFSVVALLLFVVGGSSALAELHLTLARLIAAYFVAGIAVGAFVGALRPLARTVVGTLAVGAAGGLLLNAVLRTAQDGLRFWGPLDKYYALIFAVVGAIAGLQVRSKRKGKSPHGRS